VVAENPTWSATRIHGKLKMLGFDISEQTVLRWIAFLNNYREAIAAMDFYTVPTLTFGVL
jgi:hypothetical protein